MAYNHAKAELLFKNHWAKLRLEYAQAGMSEDAIQSIYDFDREVFNGERAFVEHTIRLVTEDDAEDDDDLAYARALLEEYFEALSVTDSYFTDPLNGWLEHLESQSLINAIKMLPPEDFTLLSLYVFGELTQAELAAHYGISQKNICKKLKRIKDFLRKGV